MSVEQPPRAAPATSTRLCSLVGRAWDYHPIALCPQPPHHTPEECHLPGVLTLLDQDVPHNPRSRDGAQTRVLILSRQICVGRLLQVMACNCSDGIEVCQQVSQGDLGHRLDLLRRLPVTTTHRV